MVDPEEMISGFNQFASGKLIDQLRELLSEKDPTIDWARTRIIADFKTNRYFFESEDPLIEENLRLIYEKLTEELSVKPLTSS